MSEGGLFNRLTPGVGEEVGLGVGPGVGEGVGAGVTGAGVAFIRKD